MRTAICILAAFIFFGCSWAKPVLRPEKQVSGTSATGKGAMEKPHPSTLQNLDCSSAIPISIGDLVDGDNTGAPSNVDQYSCATWYESGGEVVFELTIDDAGMHSVGISMVYDESSCDLDFFILGSCNENDCLDCADHGAFFNLSGPATYYIVVDGYGGDECPFALTIVDGMPPADCCPLTSVCQTFNFAGWANNFETLNCGGVDVWNWGTSGQDPPEDCDSEPFLNVLATNTSGPTPDYAGEIAFLGPVGITAECSCMELCHYYYIEEYWDGGNVKVSTDGGSTWESVVPASFYDGQDEFLSLDTACLRGELAYSSEDQPFEFRTDCFDLLDYAGEDVLIGFFYGSDGSVGETGWYIHSVNIGSSGTPVEDRSWGAIKAIYR